MKQIAVLGAGTMGIGIVRLFAEHGYEVCLYEPHMARTVLEEKLRSFEDNRMNGSGRPDDSRFSVRIYEDISKAIANADLIVEAVPEQLEIKREVYRQLAQNIRDNAIVASNTSTFALETLAENQPFSDRMIIMHFFNPAHLIPLVEIVGLPDTPSAIIDETVNLMRSCGKTPVVLKRDIPGFIANRLQAALLREAFYLLENGIADAEQIDTVVKEALGLRYAFKGPFEIADLGGLDIWSKVTGHLFPELGVSRSAPESLLAKAAEGQLGAKSGAGFYRYDDADEVKDNFEQQLQDLVRLKRESSPL